MAHACSSSSCMCYIASNVDSLACADAGQMPGGGRLLPYSIWNGKNPVEECFAKLKAYSTSVKKSLSLALLLMTIGTKQILQSAIVLLCLPVALWVMPSAFKKVCQNSAVNLISLSRTISAGHLCRRKISCMKIGTSPLAETMLQTGMK